MKKAKAIKKMKKREDIIYKRMLDYKNNGKDSFLDFDKLLKKKDYLENKKSVAKIIVC